MSTTTKASRKARQTLQVHAHTRYVRLLKAVCRAHQTQPWAQESLLVLNKTRNSSDLTPLLDLADSLSEQKYSDASQHFEANQFASLIRKYDFPKGSVVTDPRKKAKEKFLQAERKCGQMNRKFLLRSSRTGKPCPYEFEFDHMRKFIAYVLGYEPRYENILNMTGFGPGAAIGVNGNATNVARKLLCDSWTVTAGAYHHAFHAVMRHAQVREVIFPNQGGFTSGGFDYCPHKGPFSKKAEVVAYNKISFVPKTARTHRTIAVEPLLNSFLQKGVDEHMRKRLLRIGIDLTNQERNGSLAKIGSRTGEEDPFCTIDLSAASDSISIGLVSELLPQDWFDFLNSIRSKNFMLDGVIHKYEKFCSMGNGFCFPLETLLFVAACNAIGAGKPGDDFLVYGDDIIVRQSKTHKLIKLLAYMGFRTNKEKTFLEGPFRESCGQDWFDGQDVRPYTLKNRLDSIENIFKLLNGTSQGRRKAFFEGVRPLIISWVPREYLFFRPYPGPEDTCITSVDDEYLHSEHCRYSYKNGNGAWIWKELIHTAVPDNGAHRHDYIATAMVYAALIGSASETPFVLRRKTRTKVRLISHSGATSQWLPA